MRCRDKMKRPLPEKRGERHRIKEKDVFCLLLLLLCMFVGAAIPYTKCNCRLDKEFGKKSKNTT